MGPHSEQDKTGEDLQPKQVKGWQGGRGGGQEAFSKAKCGMEEPDQLSRMTAIT